MTASDIQRRLIVERYRRNFLMPNFTPKSWWECDVFELTPAGFFREYEIKLTRADFRADTTKIKERFVGSYPFTRIEENKHDLLAKADPRGPNQFWYVFPAGLIADSEVPAWAGIIHALPGRGARAPWTVNTVTIRKAPMLHRRPADPKIRQYAEGICYWRFHSLFMYGRTAPPTESLYQPTEPEPTAEARP